MTGTALDPSGEDTQISDSPDRFDRNATRSASGDRLGMPSNRVEAIAVTGAAAAGAPAEAVSTRQMFPSAKLRTYNEPVSTVTHPRDDRSLTVLTNEWQSPRLRHH